MREGVELDRKELRERGMGERRERREKKGRERGER